MQTNEAFGMNLEDCARIDVPIVEAVIANTIPLTLWMLHYIYSDEVLCGMIRLELLQLLNGNTMEWKDLPHKCPLFVATWHEVCRITVALPTIRTVLHDMTLKDQYLLRKNEHIIIFPGMTHSDHSIWGDDLSFNPRRFLIEDKLAKGKSDLRPSVRIFGGGKHLCPGRHFAFNEIMSIVAMLILKIDIQPADGTKWEMPAMNISAPSLGVQMPGLMGDLQVTMTPRTEFQDKVIGFDFGGM